MSRQFLRQAVPNGLLMLFLSSPMACIAQVPIGQPPHWVMLKTTDESTTEYETGGVYTQGEYTYVALRTKETRDPSWYILTVNAFNCSKQRVSTALLGRMSIDGTQVESGKMNDERILAKYSDEISKDPDLAKVGAFVCAKP